MANRRESTVHRGRLYCTSVFSSPCYLLALLDNNRIDGNRDGQTEEIAHNYFRRIIAQSMLYNPFYNTLNHHMSFPLTFLADE